MTQSREKSLVLVFDRLHQMTQAKKKKKKFCSLAKISWMGPTNDIVQKRRKKKRINHVAS